MPKCRRLAPAAVYAVADPAGYHGMSATRRRFVPGGARLELITSLAPARRDSQPISAWLSDAVA